MKGEFELVGASIVGREHLRVGRNNQDASYWISDREATIAIVCDGCGSSAHSEVGAKLASQIVAKLIRDRLPQEGFSPEFWQQVQQDLLQNFKDLAAMLGGELVQVVKEYLLFTIIGTVITQNSTVVFAIGDGAIALNGEDRSIPAFTNNAPPYTGYGLIPDYLFEIQPEQLQFQIHCQLPTQQIQSLLIGSDGVGDLVKVAEQRLPGKSEQVGTIAQFWQKDIYFQNPDSIRRRLALINHSSTKPDWESRCLRQEHGLLPDDTTLVVIRRKKV